MEEILSYLLGGVVTILSGDRVYQSVRARRNGNGPATKADMKDLNGRIDNLAKTVNSLAIEVEYHKGQHHGL